MSDGETRAPRGMDWFALCLALGALLACDGGLNLNEQTVGNGDDGVTLAFGNIAVDPSGRYFLVRAQGQAAQIEIDSGRARVLESLPDPLQLAFSPSGDRLYAVVDRGRGDRATLVGYELAGDRLLFERDIRFSLAWGEGNGPGRSAIQVTADCGFVVINSDAHLWAFRSDDGEAVLDRELETRIADVDLLADGERLLVTLMERWRDQEPETDVLGISLAADVGADATLRIQVPNCASELTVGQGERFAYLAPTTCEVPQTRTNKDPISVLDLESGEFVRNLPGFGPVGLAAGGEVLVGFMDMDALDRDLFLEGDRLPEPGARYRLMFVDAESLRFDTLELGDELPRYAVTPDGEVVLVDYPRAWLTDEARIRVVDVQARSMRPASGPLVAMQHFAFTSDAREAYLLDGGLYRLDVPEALVESVGIPFSPTNLNLTSDDRFLVLRESDGVLWTYDVPGEALHHRIELSGDRGGIRVDVEVDIDVALRASVGRSD